MQIKVANYINEQHLLHEHDKVVVGLSGGADSVALLLLLHRLGYTCVAAHCNFHLRADESDRDAAFAKAVADRIGVTFQSVDFDTTGYAGRNHLSIEMAARDLRYQWFEETRRSLGAAAIAVAHHQDDSVETVLLNLIRGTGIRGLSGISARNGYVVRPLLCVSRDEIVEWLGSIHQSFVTDSTNLSDVYTRNFIRLRVLPLLSELNPSIKESIAQTASNLSEAKSLYLYAMDEAKRRVCVGNRIDIPALMAYPAARTVLYELLLPYHFSPLVAKDAFESVDKESGKLFLSSTHRLWKDRDSFIIEPIQTDASADNTYYIDRSMTRITEPIGLSFTICSVKELTLVKDSNKAYFDLDKLSYPLSVRKWQTGDWFVPFGMHGKKKLSDYFANQKFSILQKKSCWLLLSGKDILWVVGNRADNRFRVDENTKNVLIVDNI